MSMPSGPMPPDRVRHAISYLTGEVAGLFMFCQMLAKIHPNHNFLIQRLDEIEQLGIGTISASPAPDVTLEGFEFVMEGLRKAITTAAAMR